MNLKTIIPALACVLLPLSCIPDNNESYTVLFTFYDDTDVWTGDFADYPSGEEGSYQLSFGWSHLPLPLDTTKGALRISGNNHSDDLFMFVRRKVDGLRPNTAYRFVFNIVLASDAPTNAAGTGGAPGEGVTLKVGVTRIMPDKIAGSDYYFGMNIDKGNQTESGTDMFAIGNIGVSDTTTVFTFIDRNSSSRPMEVTADENGECWVIIGTDSGFEGTTTLYYSKIKLTITRI